MQEECFINILCKFCSLSSIICCCYLFQLCLSLHVVCVCHKLDKACKLFVAIYFTLLLYYKQHLCVALSTEAYEMYLKLDFCSLPALEMQPIDYAYLCI